MNTIVFAEEQSRTFHVKLHTHETWELVYCVSGGGTFRLHDGRCIPYREGEIVAIPPDTPHENIGEEGFSNIHVNLANPTFPYRDVFKVQDQDGLLYHSFSAAGHYYAAHKIKKELILASLGDLIASCLVVFRSNTAFSEPVEQIRQEILKNYAVPGFALDEFIRTMPFHYDYLRKIFKKEVGMSPLEYMTGLRMKNAERLLTTEDVKDCSVGEIARRCGYENSLYFSRVYKKYYGCSPMQYIHKRREINTADPGRREAEWEE